MYNFKVHKLRIKESFEMPSEGIFWIINNKLIAFDNYVDTTGRQFENIEHNKIWDEIKHMYKVNGKIVDYNYFPRGRVMVNPIRKNDIFSHYDIYIYIDKCINNNDIIEEIKYHFNLNKPSCHIKYIGTDGGITDNHYVCNNCK